MNGRSTLAMGLDQRWGVMTVTIFVYVAILNWISNRRHLAQSGSIQRKAA